MGAPGRDYPNKHDELFPMSGASRKALRRWMRVLLVTAGSVLLLGVTLPLAGCDSSSPSPTAVAQTAAAPTSSVAAQVTDPLGGTCTSLDSSGYCPGDDPTTVTDPNGQSCASLDSAGYCPGDDPSPSAAAPTMTKQTDTIVFKVEGSGYPSIQYGTDSSDNNPSGGYGPLGDGNPLPWTASAPYDSSALYYYVSAQLEGSGDISDSVTEVVETWCSDGTHHTESFPLASGQASGGYAIASAEYTGGDTGNAGQAESDAGC
jgi:hypothetical protein